MYGVVLILSLAAAAADPAERSLPLMTAAEAQAAMQRGEAQFRAGNWPEAERLLAEVLRASEAGLLKPAARTRCLGLLASTYARLDRDREAIGFGLRWRDSLKSLPSDPAGARDQGLQENAIFLAGLFVKAKRYAEAEDVLGEALAGPGREARTAKDLSAAIRGLRVRVELARVAALRQQATVPALRDDAAARAKQVVARIEGGAATANQVSDCLLALDAMIEVQPEAAAECIERLAAQCRRRKDSRLTIAAGVALHTAYEARKDYDKAWLALTRALAEQRKTAAFSAEEMQILDHLCQLALVEGAGGAKPESDAATRLREAAAQYEQSLAAGGTQADLRLQGLRRLVQFHRRSGDAAQAARTAERLLQEQTGRPGATAEGAMETRRDLAELYLVLGRYEQASPLLSECLDWWQRRQPPERLQVAQLLGYLAAMERTVGSHQTALEHFQQALAIQSRELPEGDPRLVYSYNSLGSVLADMGQYCRAIAAYHEALAQCRKPCGAGVSPAQKNAGETPAPQISGETPAPQVLLECRVRLNLAMAYKSQGQWKSAIRECRDSLALLEDQPGADVPTRIAHATALAGLERAQGNLPAAQKLAEQAIELCRQQQIEQGPLAAGVRHQLATIAQLEGDPAAAERHWSEALAIYEAQTDAQKQLRTLNALGGLAASRGRWQEAESRYRKALAAAESLQAFPLTQFVTLSNLAILEYRKGARPEAGSLLRRAIALAEAPRAMTSGAEEDRAEYLAQFATAFDLLVDWDLEAGEVARALADAERARNRTYFDQLQLAGVDLRTTLGGPDGVELLRREQAARLRYSSLRARWLAERSEAAAGPPRDTLRKELADAEQAYAAVWKEIRDASPLYRRILSEGRDPAGDIFKEVLNRRNLMLFYYLGDRRGYLIVIDTAAKTPKVFNLEIARRMVQGNVPGNSENSEGDSPIFVERKSGQSPERKLGQSPAAAESVPLTRSLADRLVQAYLRQVSSGPDVVLADRSVGEPSPGPAPAASQDLGLALSQCLLPAEVLEYIRARSPEHLVVVPDGALHQLPLEALVLSSGASPRYVVDELPPIAYAPSVAVMSALAQRKVAASRSVAPVLTVGNPAYPQANDAGRSAMSSSAARSAFAEFGGRLTPLPGTRVECQRIVKAFGADQVAWIEGPEATEANVRSQVRGRRIVHLAAHGLVDREHENLFGAIALAPAAEHASPEDDGFLSLHEIHGLPLVGCELVVLSACETNVGPRRRLEAGSTLTQAFLAAGAKRVVSSLWRVNDAASAEMMGQFFSQVADATARGGQPDYAAALQTARRRVRSDPRWSAPYYWAAFVLIGPAE